MYRDAHIQGVHQMASDIAVLIIGFASGMSAVTIVKGFKIGDADSLGNAEKSSHIQSANW